MSGNYASNANESNLTEALGRAKGSNNESTSSFSDSVDMSSFISESGNNGKYGDEIGTGKHAKTNIIWYIISAIFVVFSCISICIFVLEVNGFDIDKFSQSVKDLWGGFTPILTLSLGYLFGKKSVVKKEDDIKNTSSS